MNPARVPQPEASWIAVSPAEGRLGPGESEALDLQIDATGIAPGVQAGRIDVLTNDPTRPVVVHPLTLAVGSAPALAASSGSLDFGEVFVGGAATRAIVLDNIGTEPLVVSGITAAGELSIQPVAFTVLPMDDREVHVTFAPTGLAPLDSTLTIARPAYGS